VVTLSVLGEIAQIPAGRDASLNGLFANWFGAAGFLSAAIVFSSSISVPKGRGRYLIMLGVALIIWPMLPLAKVSAAYLERNQALPSLVRFDSRFGDAFFRLQNSHFRRVIRPDMNLVAAEISLLDGPWPGIIFHDLWPNWESYSTLLIGIENPGAESLSVNVRVHDRMHNVGDQPFSDRFNLSYELQPGRHTLRIPLKQIRNAPRDRQMDLSQIEGIVVFCPSKYAGRVFELLEIRLE